MQPYAMQAVIMGTMHPTKTRREVVQPHSASSSGRTVPMRSTDKKERRKTPQRRPSRSRHFNSAAPIMSVVNTCAVQIVNTMPMACSPWACADTIPVARNARIQDQRECELEVIFDIHFRIQRSRISEFGLARPYPCTSSPNSTFQ